MSTFSLQARWVLPVDRPPIAGGVVTVAAGRISAVGGPTSCEGPTRDLGDVVLIPGLVNAHTHLEFSNLDSPLGHKGMPLTEWIHLVIAHRQGGRQNVNTAIATGICESLQCGVTTLANIATTPTSLDKDSPSPRQVNFQEAIGFSSARVSSVLEDVRQRIESSREQSTGNLPVALGLSPHAPYSVHPQLLEKLVDLALEQQLPMAMHLAESPEELQLLTDSTGPFYDLLQQRSMWDAEAIPLNSCPLDYLEALARAPRALVIHGNYLASNEIDFLAEERERVSLVFCPRTHRYFDHARYPLEKMLAAGVRVALGTDSRASNPDLSLLEEMRYVARHHEEVSPAAILQMGTITGAEALGLAREVGSLSPGKWADLAIVPCDGGCDDPIETILNGDQLPSQTWIRGRLVSAGNETRQS